MAGTLGESDRVIMEFLTAIETSAEGNQISRTLNKMYFNKFRGRIKSILWLEKLREKGAGCKWVPTEDIKKCNCKQGRRNGGVHKKPLWLYKNNQTNKTSEYLK